jgi:hypothetical protein
MAIAYPFTLNVKAFSAAYCDIRHSVNDGGSDETRLKDLGRRASQLGPLGQIALPEASTTSSEERL